MSRHISSEWLSAYLDGETGLAETQTVDSHLAACEPCRVRLESARRLVGGLRRLAPAEVPPPPELAARIHRQIAAAATAAADGSDRLPAPLRRPRAPGWAQALRTLRALRALRTLRALRSWIWWHDLPPLRSSFSTPLGVGMALLVAALLVEHGSGPGLTSLYPAVPRYPPSPTARLEPEFLVSAAFGEAPAVLPQTTSQVAGRVFVLSDDVWVQRGLDASDAMRPQARVPARSPAGRALLAKFSDLGMLLADGSRVVLRYNLETLEIWNGS
jgi:anti-sigma factor RsiW